MNEHSHTTLTRGDVLDGKYVLGECIGQGGMGSVFLAEQPALGRTVAIKVLHPDLAHRPAHAGRLRDEAMTACRVRSSHCLSVIDCSSLPDGASYLVMEYIPGRSLARLAAEETLPLSRVVELFDQVLVALASTHDAGIVHADVKSDNFLVECFEGRDHVTMIDFGLARFASSPGIDVEDGEAIVSGTPEYMAPEVVCGGPPVLASDLYAAGVILYEFLTGTTPFGGGSAASIMVRHAYDVAVPPSLRRPDRNIPAALDRVVMRALEKQPEARFRDAAEFAQALRAAVGPRPVPDVALRPSGAHPESATRNCRASRPRRRIARGSIAESGGRPDETEQHYVLGSATLGSIPPCST
jgi:serine/threonine-protein kinase